MAEWKKYNLADFENKNINQYHLDTRDFHILESEDINKHKDYHTLKLYPKRFFYTAEEVKQLIEKLFIESGGEGKWRMLAMKGIGNWGLKYIRIYRYDLGLLVCDSNNHALNKAFWEENELDKENIHTH